MFCPRLDNPDVKREFDMLSDFLGNKIAGLVYHKNNGNFLDKTPKGEDSLMFQELVKATGSISMAYKIKAQFYTDKYLAKNNWLESGVEPISEIYGIGNNISVLNTYKANNLETLYALERLPSGISAFVNDIQVPRPKYSFVVNNKFVKPAIKVGVGENFYLPEIDNNIKKYIVSKYFRLSDTLPYYPFSMGNDASNIRRVKTINAEFGGRKAVVFNTKKGVIEFSPNINDLSFTTNNSDVIESLREEEDFIYGITNEESLKNIPQNITEVTDFEGTQIEYVQNIGVMLSGESIGARNINRGEKILIDLSAMKSKFDRKTWTAAVNSESLAKDEFSSLEELLLFTFLHEKAHKYIFKNSGESTRSYETRINNEALKRLRTEYKTIKPKEHLSSVESLGSEVETKLDADKEMIARYKGLIDLINKSLSEKTGRKDTLLARRDRLQEKIEELKTDGTNLVIIKQAESDITLIKSRLDDIEANLYKELDESQIWDMMADLQELGAYIRGWDGLSQMLDAYNISLKEIEEKITASSGKLESLHNKYLEMVKRAFVKYANKVSYRSDFSDKLFNALEDESLTSRMVFGASMSNSDLIKIIDDIIKQAAFKINNDTKDNDLELTNWLTKLQKHLGTKDENKISERFHQMDKNGNWTGGIVSKIKQDYFDTVSEIAEKASKTGNWKPFFKFLADNTYEMLESEFNAYLERKEAGLDFDIKKISSQKNSNGEYVLAEKDFISQEKLITRYNDHKEAYKKEVLSMGNYLDINNDFVSQDLEHKFLSIMNDWEMKNNPWYKVIGRERNPFAHYRIRDRIDSKWFDAKFAAIEKDSLLKQFYDFYRERMKDNDASLPYHKKEQSNLIYGVRKTMAEELSEARGIAKVSTLVKDEIMGLVMAESQSNLEGRVIVGDKIYKNIPVGMLYTSLTGKERSPSIFKSLKEHTDVATNYKYKLKVEPIANAAQDIIDQMSAVRGVDTDEGESFKKSKYTGGAHKQKGALFNSRARLEYLIDSTLHGESQSAPDVHGEGRITVKGDKMKYSMSKFIDSLIKFTYLKALSVPNIISPTVNLGIGLVNNYSYSSGEVDFTDASLSKAYVKMFSAISRTLGKNLHLKDFEQIMTWLIRLDVLPDINSAAFEDSATWDKWLTILQSKGEYLNQGATMVAYLIHNKVKDKNGKDISILDAYTVSKGNLVWNTELMGEQSKTSANDIISSDGKGVNLYRLSEKIKGINEYIHGDYGSKLEIKKTAYGRALSLFKTWLPMTVEHRFGAERYDRRLQRNVKGRYRSLVTVTTREGVELSIKKIIPLLLKAIVSKKAFNVLSDVDKINLKRDLRELQIIGALTLVGMMLMGAGDDDDDPVKMRALNILINLMSKTQSDLEFYLNPASMSSIVNNAIPIIGTMKDMTNIVGAFYDTIIGDGLYEKGPLKDASKLGVSIGRMFPVTNGAVKMWNYSEQRFNFGERR